MVVKKFKGYFRLYSRDGESLFTEGNKFSKYTEVCVKHFSSKNLLLEDISSPFHDTMYDYLEACDYTTWADFLADAKKRVSDLWSDNDIIVECATGTILEPLSFGLEKVLVNVVNDLWAQYLPQREAEIQREQVRKAQLEQELADAKKLVSVLTNELAQYD